MTDGRTVRIASEAIPAIEREVVAPVDLDGAGAGDLGDVGVEGVGRLEGQHRPPGAPVRQAQRLEHLVRSVGREHVGRRRRRRAPGRVRSRRCAAGAPSRIDRDSGASRCRRAPAGARPTNSAGGGSGASLVFSRTRRRAGASGSRPSARRRRAPSGGLDRPSARRRSRMDSAWAARPSASASASTARSDRVERLAVDGDHVVVLEEVVDGQRGREPCGPVGRQDVARARDVVADRRRGPRTAEDGTGVVDQGDEPFGVGAQDLEVLGGHQVRRRRSPPRANRRRPRNRLRRGWPRCPPGGARRRSGDRWRQRPRRRPGRPR